MDGWVAGQAPFHESAKHNDVNGYLEGGNQKNECCAKDRALVAELEVTPNTSQDVTAKSPKFL